MDPFNAGWLSILPPVIAIVLALCTKEVISSLLIGILSGTFIYAVGMDHANLLMGTVQTTFKLMSTKVDFNILMFCTMLGALVYTISMAGEAVRMVIGLFAESEAVKLPYWLRVVWVHSSLLMTISTASPSAPSCVR